MHSHTYIDLLDSPLSLSPSLSLSLSHFLSLSLSLNPTQGLYWNDNVKDKSRNSTTFIHHLYAFDPEFTAFMADALTFLATSGFYGIMLAMQVSRVTHTRPPARTTADACK